APAVTDCAAAEIDRERSVRKSVNVTPAVDRRSQAHEVVHVCAEPVQQHDKGIAFRLIVTLRFDNDVAQSAAFIRASRHPQLRYPLPVARACGLTFRLMCRPA